MWDWTGEPYNWSDVILMTPKEVADLEVRLEATEKAGNIANWEVYEMESLGTIGDVLECIPDLEEVEVQQY
jgi:hypothetical protein